MRQPTPLSRSAQTRCGCSPNRTCSRTPSVATGQAVCGALFSFLSCTLFRAPTKSSADRHPLRHEPLAVTGRLRDSLVARRLAAQLLSGAAARTPEEVVARLLA